MPTLTFDGEDFLFNNTTFPDMSRITVFAVGEYEDGYFYQQAILEISDSTTYSGAMFIYSSSWSFFHIRDPAGRAALLMGHLPEKQHIFTGIANGIKATYYIDGNFKADTNANNLINSLNRIDVGGGFNHPVSPFKGTIAEVIVYNHPLTPLEREDVEKYLSQKWGIDLDN